MKKLPLLLFFLATSAQAAQYISDAAISEIATKLEWRFTHNPTTGQLAAWERHIQDDGTNVCFVQFINPVGVTLTGFSVSPVQGTRLRLENNNGTYFLTNAYGFSQSDKDWCTQ